VECSAVQCSAGPFPPARGRGPLTTASLRCLQCSELHGAVLHYDYSAVQCATL
jgi:hypothetical protein